MPNPHRVSVLIGLHISYQLVGSDRLATDTFNHWFKCWFPPLPVFGPDTQVAGTNEMGSGWDDQYTGPLHQYHI
jgi:hypothetical protein